MNLACNNFWPTIRLVILIKVQGVLLVQLLALSVRIVKRIRRHLTHFLHLVIIIIIIIIAIGEVHDFVIRVVNKEVVGTIHVGSSNIIIRLAVPLREDRVLIVIISVIVCVELGVDDGVQHVGPTGLKSPPL